MIGVLAAALVSVISPAPAAFELPPELPLEVIVASAQVVTTQETTVERGTQVQMDPTLPPPTAPAAPSFANNCDEMHWYRANAGLPARFDALGWRESNCRNEDGVHTSCCYGWWQLNVSLHLRDSRIASRYRACGVDSYTDVNSDTPADKRRQACAAKALFDVVGYSAWSTS